MGEPFRWFAEHDLEDGIFVEIGSQRGEGSTGFLAKYCMAQDVQFFSIDVDYEAVERVRKIEGCEALYSTGEDMLRKMGEDYPDLEIAGAYLDNFDWIYSHLDQNIVKEQRRAYQVNGQDLNNWNSQIAHLQQAALIHKLACEGCLLVFDDTWKNKEGLFTGKGGAAIPLLLDHGWRILRREERAIMLTNAP